MGGVKQCCVNEYWQLGERCRMGILFLYPVALWDARPLADGHGRT